MIAYYVQPGDTLASIANMFGVTVRALQMQNNLNDTMVQVREMLLIPVGTASIPPANATPYVVQKGESLYSIAHAHNVSLETMLALNPLPNPNLIFPGQVIYLPMMMSLQNDPRPHNPSSAMMPCKEGQFQYIVQPGDSVYQLATMFKTSVEEIVAVNKLKNPDLLIIGQTLCIPQPVQCGEGAVAYMVKDGDTMYNIAMSMNTTVAEIQAMNPYLNPARLAVGQTICLPQMPDMVTELAQPLLVAVTEPGEPIVAEAMKPCCGSSEEMQPTDPTDPTEPMPEMVVPDIFNMNLVQLRQMMAEGKLTSVELVKAYMERIAACDTNGPMLNTIRALNMNLLNEAMAYDREEAAGHIRGPLHGIPVLIKDNIDVVGQPTTAGSFAMKDNFPMEDSPLVTNLRNAGALILGKANMTEWANFISNRMTNGFSALGGQVLNPYGPGEFDVSGSSSGSAAATAAGLAPVAVGTETSGSIISPSNANSVYGLKPTVGMISRRGIIPIAASQDTAGPIGRSVTDITMLFQHMIGEDPQDGATLGTSRYHHDFMKCLDAEALKGKRIGVAVQAVARQDEERQAMFATVLNDLRNMGVELVDVEMPGYAALLEYSSNVLLYEFKPALNAYLKNVAPNLPVHSMLDLLAFNSAHARDQLKYGQYWVEAAEMTSGSLTEAEYIGDRLRDLLNSRTLGIDHALTEYDVEAVLFPGNSAASIGAKAGYPTLNVPIGYLSNGMPYGMTFTGTAFTECRLLGFAYAFEQAYHKRVWPTSCP